MMSAAATDIIVKIIDKIIDNIDKTVDANKNITFVFMSRLKSDCLSCCNMSSLKINQNQRKPRL